MNLCFLDKCWHVSFDLQWSVNVSSNNWKFHSIMANFTFTECPIHIQAYCSSHPPVTHVFSPGDSNECVSSSHAHYNFLNISCSTSFVVVSFLLLDAQFARLDTVQNRHLSILFRYLPAKQRISIPSSHNVVLRFVYFAFPACEEHLAVSANVVAVQGSTWDRPLDMIRSGQLSTRHSTHSRQRGEQYIRPRSPMPGDLHLQNSTLKCPEMRRSSTIHPSSAPHNPMQCAACYKHPPSETSFLSCVVWAVCWDATTVHE